MPDSGTLDCSADRQSDTVNRFFPSIGSHDRTDTDSGIIDYLNYFTLPGSGFENSSGNERYYDFVQGPVHFFAIDADTARRDAGGMAAQKAWLRNQLAKSTALWQVVFFHQSAYSSSSHGSDPAMQWPFAEWGADVVFQGHDHVYERLLRDGMVYIISGNGGKNLYEFDTAISGSALRYNAGYGAVLVEASDTTMGFEGWSVPENTAEGAELVATLVDTYHLPALRQGCTVANVSINADADDVEQDQSTGRVDLNSTGLEMVDDAGIKQTIGLRFAGVTVPAGMHIDNATIEFTARAQDVARTDLTFFGQASDRPASFSDANNDVWGRPRTSASVQRDDIPAWLRTSPRTRYRTPDLSTIVQEIVDRPGWVSGNSMPFLIEGSGRRTAYAHDHALQDAPWLSILYCEPHDVTGKVWLDRDRIGVQEPGEPRSGGTTVRLWNAGGDGKAGGDDDQLVATASSDNQGYGFKDVPNGAYYVEFIRADGYAPTLPDRGDDNADSDADPDTGFSHVFNRSDVRVNNLDAGFYREPVVIRQTDFWGGALGQALPWLVALAAVIGLLVIALVCCHRRRWPQDSVRVRR